MKKSNTPKAEKAEKGNRGLILIGMSGSGKTTIGKILAPQIHYGFIDSDRLIEERFGQPLQTIVDSYPDKRDFLEVEREVISGIRMQQTILATGGSTCYAGEALRQLGGIIIFLKIDWQELVARLGSFAERGVIILHRDIQEEYLARQESYLELADIVIDCNQKSIEELVTEIKKEVGI